MKKLRKMLVWLVCLMFVISHVPLVYAEELHRAIETYQIEKYHEKAIEEAEKSIIGSENANTGGNESNPSGADTEILDKTAGVTEIGDAIQQPQITKEGMSDEEADLRAKYGSPIVESGQEQIYKVDETNFVTHIGNQIRTYQNENGVEVPVDLSLYSYHADGNNYYLPKKTPVDVILPARVTETDPINVVNNQEKIELYPLDQTYENATVQENAILYNNVEGATDVQYTVQANGVKEEIILTKWEEKHRFTYVLKAKDYDVVLENNQILVRSKGQEEILFVLTAPSMMDAAGETSQDLKLELLETDGNYHVTVVAGKEWLADSNRQYPVRIDPTITVPRENILDSVTSTVHGQYQGQAYGYVGYMTVELMGMTGVPGVMDIGRSRMFFKVNYDFKKSIPTEAKIDSATLNLYQYTSPGQQETVFGAYRLTEDFDINTVTWDSSIGIGREIAGENAISPKKEGMHHFDIRETVNGWVQGLYPNYGLVVAATNEDSDGAAFYTTEATATNAGQLGFTPEKAPSVTIHWSVPDPVDINYALGDTTINLRTMVKTDIKGKLQFKGVFADGLTTPGAIVSYQLNDTSKNYSEKSLASLSYKYPNTAPFISAFETGTTQYKDKLSNWQTLVPFTDPEHNTLYTIDAISEKNGESSGKKTSDSFIIYKVTQYDTLPKIAAYYGVSLKQIAYDNRIQDMLLLKNNTLFIRNPQKNATKPYNPPALTDKTKGDVDMLLMGRGLHCEFGFEPINLNTGNFYLERTDVTIPELGGAFDIVRSYNSKTAEINGLFGRGWSVAFNEQLSMDEEGNLYYTRADGSVLPFIKEGDRYVAPAGYDLTLVAKDVEKKKADFGNGEETYSVKEYYISDTENKEKVFNFHGLLIRQTDERGNTTKLEYNDNAQLIKITSPTGLVFSITSTQDGYIGAVGLPNGSTLTYEYDDNGYLTSYTDAVGVVTRYEYDANGLMTAWYDGNGNKVVENAYDSAGRVIKQTDATGAVSTLTYSDGQTTTTDANKNSTTYHYDKLYRTTKISYPDNTVISKTYNDDNRLTSQTNELGETTGYTYDKKGNVLTETRFDGAVKTFTYDAKNHLLSRTDFDGHTTAHSYDDSGNRVSTTLADGSTTTYSVDKEGRILSVTDAAGQQTTFAYTGANLTQIKNPKGGITTLTYNAHNQVLTVTNPLGGITTYTYDEEGRKTSEADPDGVKKTFTFDGAGQVTAVTDGNGNISTFGYDAFGHKISASNGEGGTYTYAYDGVGNQISLTDAENHITTYAYDSRNRLLSETDAAGQTIRYTRDALGRVLTRTNEAGNSSSFSYDARFSKITSSTDALGQLTQMTYDTSGNLSKVTHPIGTNTVSDYDALGRLISHTDEAGQITTYTYDIVGNRLTETTGERTTTYTYDEAGNVTSITYPDLTTVSYSYDTMGHVLSFTDAKGMKTTYEYTLAGRLISTTDPLGNKTSLSYDGNGNQNSVTDAAGYTATSDFNGQNKVSKVTDGLGNSTTFAYNQMEQLTEMTDALERKTAYSYNELGYPVSVTDANGNITTLSYTATAQVKEVTYADGSTVTNEYDALDRLTKQSQSSGLVTEYTYDAANRLLSAKDNQDLNETYTYDAAGNRLTATNSLGEVTTYTYDTYQQLIKITYADESSESYTYDSVGNRATATDVEGNITTYHYDDNGKLTKTVDHLERETKYSYDALGRVASKTDAEGNTTKYEYDVLDNLIKVTDANGNATAYGYDANKNMVLLTDPKGNNTVMKYNALNRLTERVSPTGGVETYTYDAVGNMLSHTSGEGNVTTYSYDKMNRQSSMTKPTGGMTTYSYDLSGSLSSLTDPSGDITNYTNDLYGRTTKKQLPNEAVFTYSYDKLGRLSEQTAPQGLSKTYTYDTAGNLTKETDQSERSISYTYDTAGRLLTQKNALDLETQYTYDNAGNLSGVTTPSGAKTTFSHTTLDQLKTITGPTGRKQDLTYDPVGQLIKKTTGEDRVESYTYDANGNLTEVIDPLEQTKTYAYDADNRLHTESDTAKQTVTYSYDKDHRLVKVQTSAGATASYQYDANGNVTEIKAGSERLSTYTYDTEDQLITATKGNGDQASTSTYTYDNVGNITSVTDGNGEVTEYRYDQLANIVERITALGDSETYTYDINNRLSQVKKADKKTISYDYNKLDQLLTTTYSEESEGQVLYTYDADGRRVSMSDLTGQSFYAYNEEGELTGVRQGDGSLIKYEYDQYGNITKMVYPDNSEVSYSYDALDRMTEVTDRNGAITTYTYDDAGDMTEIERGDGSKSHLTYDTGHRVTNITHRDSQENIISSYSYMYDDGNYITREVITQDGKTITQAYSYDSLGQLVTMTVYEGGNEPTAFNSDEIIGIKLVEFAYTYDLAGNKLTATQTQDGKETLTTFAYDANHRLVESKTGEKSISYEYDSNGNRITATETDETISYVYDTENRLLAVQDKEGMLFAALYDGDDNRVFTAGRTKASTAYQLFKRQEEPGKHTSPNTAAKGEENSLFWYGFSQNIIQFFSSFGTGEGYNWIETFDTISSAYHQKIAKDRATEEGLVVNPPDENHLPGRDTVTYADEVAEVLIPYTKKEDTYDYYEVRNYVNDVNRKHTEVLQTYDNELKVRETYTYGRGRTSYLNHQSEETYHYLTSQTGTVTGLTQDGIQVSSSSYHVYGETKQSTDQTGNPFAYNGEARDVTGLDYLRARYYDSQAGTFLTEDSYQGDLADPLSQNRYTYAQNNPVNYTDPSGHFSQGLSVGKAFGVNIGKLIGESIGKAVATVARKTVEVTYAVAKQTTGTANSVYNAKVSASQYVNYQKQDVDNTIYYQRKILNDYTQATENVGTARIREAKNIFLNWNNALAETLRHVCSSKAIKGQDVSFGKQSNIDTSYQTGIKDIYRHDLKNVENSHIDEMSMSELQDSYGGVISSYISFLGTGYFNPLGDPTNRVVIERYKTLKAEEEEKVAQHKNELKKFHYLNVYEEIRKTGKHPNGTPASNFEKKIAPYVSLIPAVQMGASIFASRQIIKYSDSLAGSQNKTIDLDLQTIDKLSPRDLAKMSKEQLTKRLPEDWTVWDNKGYVHYKDSKDTIRIRLDPPDKTTTFSHMHVYDENRRLLDIDGNIVDKKSPAGHIPWSD